MADGVDAPVDRMQPARRYPQVDRAAAYSERQQLAARNDPVLTIRQVRDDPVHTTRA
jgi:hypothetical protein